MRIVEDGPSRILLIMPDNSTACWTRQAAPSPTAPSRVIKARKKPMFPLFSFLGFAPAAR